MFGECAMGKSMCVVVFAALLAVTNTVAAQSGASTGSGYGAAFGEACERASDNARSAAVNDANGAWLAAGQYGKPIRYSITRGECECKETNSTRQSERWSCFGSASWKLEL